MKPEQIQKELQQIIAEMQQLLEQKPIIKLDEITIELGNAPEFGESFGVIRKEKQLVFGDWLNQIEKEHLKNYLWKGVLIREGLWFFIDNKYFSNDFMQLTNFFLNVFACAYINTNITGITKTKILNNLKKRFLLKANLENKNIDNQCEAINPLLQKVIQKNISLKDIVHTYFRFITQIFLEESAPKKVISEIKQYLSNPVEKIAAPIFLKKKAIDIIEELIKNGFKTSTTDLAKKIGVNQSTISRQITKIKNTYNCRWRKQLNWNKLDLQLFTVYITISNNEYKKIDGIISELIKEKFIDSIYSGEGKNCLFIYFLIASPRIIVENIKNKLNRMVKTEQILNFKILKVKDYQYYISFIDRPFEPSTENFELLLNKQILIKKIMTFSSKQFEDEKPYQFAKKDFDLLQFLALLKSKTITFSDYGVWLPNFNDLLIKKGIQNSSKSEKLSLLNQLQNEALETNLLQYRFWMISQTQLTYFLHIRIFDKFENENIKNTIESLTCLNSTLLMNTEEEVIIIISGPDIKSYLTQVIIKYLIHSKVNFDYCVLKIQKYRFIPFADMYAYTSKKYFIS